MIEKNSNFSNQIGQSLKLEEISTEFELSWNTDHRQEIEDVVQSTPEHLVPLVVRELVAVECELKTISGESPRIREYYRRFPEFCHEIDEAFNILNELIQCNGSVGLEGPSELPSHIGDYRIIRKIGHGGMGIVYEAIQESLDRKVAIKTLNDHPLNIPRKATRFRREARAIAKLHHNNIVNLFGSGVHNGIPYIAMHLIEGMSLDTLLIQAKTAPDKSNPLLGSRRFVNVARIGVQVANALQYAHEHGILHRDIKPSNLIVDESEKTWVSDFGLAKLSSEPEATNSIDVVGTLRYLPPEAINGNWNPSGDVYSLGLTLYELLALDPAYPENDRIQLLNRKSSGNRPKRLRSSENRVPADLENIIWKATDFQVSRRYPDARAFAEDLQRYINGESTVARPVGPLTRLAKWSMRRKAVASLLFTILTIALIGLPLLTLLWLRSEDALNQLKAEQAKTLNARGLEKNALRMAELAKQKADNATYGSSIQLAHRFLRESNITEAERILNKWNPDHGEATTNIDHRGWEWYYLQEQLDDSIMTLRGELDYVWSVAIRPDDKQIATIHGPDPIHLNAGELAGQCEAILWDAKSGIRQYKLEDSESNLFDAAFSPDGQQLATLGIDFSSVNRWRAKLIVWDVKTGKKIHVKKLPGSFDKSLLVGRLDRPYLSKIRYSPNGKYLITAPDPIEVFDATSMQPISKFEGGTEFVQLTDEKLMVTSKFNQAISAWDFTTGSITEKSLDDGAQPQDLALTEDASLISCLTNRKLQVKDSDNLTSDSKFKLDLKKVYWGRIDPQGKSCFYSDPSGMLSRRYFSLPNFHVKRFGHKNSITSSAFSHDMTRLLTGSLDGTAKVWNVETACVSRVFESFQTGLDETRMADIEFSDDDEIVYASRSRRPEIASIPNCGNLSVSGTKQVNIQTTFYAHWPRTDFDFDPRGQWLAAPAGEHKFPRNAIDYSKSDSIGVWSTDDWRQYQMLHVGMTEIRSVAWNADGSSLAVAGKCDNQPTVQIYGPQPDHEPAESGPLFHVPLVEMPTESVACLAFRGNQLAIAFDDGSIHVWDIEGKTGAQNDWDRMKLSAKHFFTGDGQIRYLDFSPDGTWLAAAVKDKGNVRVFDLHASKLLYENPGPRDICCVKFSPNGRRLALAGYEGSVVLCDAASGNRLMILMSSLDAPGETPTVSRIIFNDTGTKIATNNHLGVIAVWKLPSESNWDPMSKNKTFARTTGIQVR